MRDKAHPQPLPQAGGAQKITSRSPQGQGRADFPPPASGRGRGWALSTPRPIAAILNFTPTAFLARLLLVSAYLTGAVTKLGDWPAAIAEQAHFGLTPPALWAGLTIAVELIGPLLILSGRLVWLGAGMLGVFTFLAALTANAFWAMPEGAERFAATNAFFEHMGLVGGFVLVAVLAWRAQNDA